MAKIKRNFNNKSYSGLDVDRPDALPFGDEYLATDTGITYRYGSQGLPVAVGSGSVGSGGVTTADLNASQSAQDLVIADKLNTTDFTNKISEYASTANGEGASLIGVEDVAGNYTGTTSEEVFAEIATKLTGSVTTYIDSSAGATIETLLASTGTGIVKLFTNSDVTNSATLSVQTGETLNGVVDQTFLFSNYGVGAQFRVDEVDGGWVVSVVGATNLLPRQYLSATLSDITYVSGSGNIIYTGSNSPVSGEVSLISADYFDEGTTRTLYLNYWEQSDDPFVLDLGSNIVPPGASVTSCYGSSTNLSNIGLPISVSKAFGTTSQININRSDDITGDVNWDVVVKIDLGQSAGQVVLAGMVSVSDIVDSVLDALPSPTVSTNTYRVTSDNNTILNENQEGVLTFQVYDTNESVSGLSSFDGTSISVTSGLKSVVVEANIIVVGDIEFEGVFNIEEVVPSGTFRPTSEGVYGLNSATRPATITIEPNTTVSLNITTSKSSYNNKLRENSYIQIKEI